MACNQSQAKLPTTVLGQYDSYLLFMPNTPTVSNPRVTKINSFLYFLYLNLVYTSFLDIIV